MSNEIGPPLQEYAVWTRANPPTRFPSRHFTYPEFTCHCGICSQQKISTRLLVKLDSVRDALGVPVLISSGFRCDAYQARLIEKVPGAAKHSQHTIGNAVDVRTKDLADMPKLQALLETEFKAMGVAHTFIHVDMRVDKVRRWTYA